MGVPNGFAWFTRFLVSFFMVVDGGMVVVNMVGQADNKAMNIVQ